MHLPNLQICVLDYNRTTFQSCDLNRNSQTWPKYSEDLSVNQKLSLQVQAFKTYSFKQDRQTDKHRDRQDQMQSHLRFTGHGSSYLHLCASVTKQYNLVPAKGDNLFGWENNCGPDESNGSLPPGLWLMSPAGWLPRNRDQLHAQCS